MINVKTTNIDTINGHQLASVFYSPAEEVKGVILIVPAMGVTQKFYAALASWLATQGYLVATFDYSGIGQSQVGHLRDSKVTISDWANFDCAAMVDACSSMAQGKPLYWIGHSLGGQILGMVPNQHLITKVISIASGSGYWLENVSSLKWRVWWLWFFVVPIATRLYGYFPGRRLRKIGDLPRGVMNQWRTWCLNPEYLIGIEGETAREKYKSVVLPITSFSFTDDEMMSHRNISSLHDFYSTASKVMNRIDPKDIGIKHIGHFGFFKAKFETNLWGDYLLPELN